MTRNRLTTCTNKETGERYACQVKESWGKRLYSLDGQVWHQSSKVARSESSPECYALAIAEVAKMDKFRADHEGQRIQFLA